MPRFKILKKVFSSYIKLFAYRPKVFQTELKRVMFFSNVSARQFVGLSSFRAGDYKKRGITRSNPTLQAKILLLLGLPCIIVNDCIMLQGLGVTMVE